MESKEHVRDVNAAYAENEDAIYHCIRRNWKLVAGMKLDKEDVAQDLGIRMFKAIQRYDPSYNIPLSAYIRQQLQWEFHSICKRYKPHGMTGLQGESRFQIRIVFLDKSREDGYTTEIPASSDYSVVECGEILQRLTPEERTVSLAAYEGQRIMKKAEQALLACVQQKVSAYYGSETAAHTAAQ